MKSCGRTQQGHKFSVESRGAAEDYPYEHDGAGGDVLPKSGDMQEN
jgi:hypothetical protein